MFAVNGLLAITILNNSKLALAQVYWLKQSYAHDSAVYARTCLLVLLIVLVEAPATMHILSTEHYAQLVSALTNLIHLQHARIPSYLTASILRMVLDYST